MSEASNKEIDDKVEENKEEQESQDTSEITEIEYLTYEEVVEEQEDNAKEYHNVTIRLELFSTVFGLVTLFLLVWFGFPNFLRNSSPFGSSYSFLSVAFVSLLFYLVDFIISFPIAYYRERIEHKFDFATRSTKEWLMDQAKELGIGVVIYLVLLEALFAALHFASNIWWIYAFLGYFIFAGILSSLSPYLISIFTEVKPLEDGIVRETVEGIANQMNLEYKDIYNWQMSDQTKKANAAVAGFGSTIRIMLGDTLTENFRPDEIEVVMAHEIAHQKSKDIYRSIAFSGVISLMAFYLIDLGFPWAMTQFNLSSKSDPAAVGYIFLGMSVILLFLGKLSLWFSRTREKAADQVAIEEVKNLEVFESAFARLSKQNLAFPNPSRLEVWWRYSHPPIRDRIQYAEKFYESLNKE